MRCELDCDATRSCGTTLLKEGLCKALLLFHECAHVNEEFSTSQM